MRSLYLCTLFFLLNMSHLFGQTYWQQEVNYTLDVRLDDVAHTLKGNETFE